MEQLGRDTVEAVVWPMSEAAAVLLDRSLRLSEHETALEVGWLLAELEQRFGYGLDELARRFDRSVSWVSRRLALVEVLPEAIQQQVREGKILAQVALKFLVPVARQNLDDCHPTLSLEQVDGAITFYLGNRAEAEEDLAERRRFEDKISRTHPNPPEIKEKFERMRRQMLDRRS